MGTFFAKWKLVYNAFVVQGYTYIDGFNLFHGLKDAGYRQYYWLDLHILANKLLNHFGFQAEFTRYFTARAYNTHHSFEHQRVWLDAVATRPNVKVGWGEFRKTEVTCSLCGGNYEIAREKRTDVNLGVHVLEDLIKVRPAAILLITGDSDQVPTAAALKRYDNQYPLFVAFPPNRVSDHLRGIVGRRNTIHLDEAWLDGCCMPDRISEKIQKPKHWIAGQ